jgi:hypothetical protein
LGWVFPSPIKNRPIQTSAVHLHHCGDALTAPLCGKSFTPLNAGREARAAHPVAALGRPIFALRFCFSFVFVSFFCFLSFLLFIIQT